MPIIPPRYGAAVYGSGVRYTAAAPADPPVSTPHRTHSTPRPMNDILTNRLTMVGTCLTLAQSAQHSPVWTGQPPLDFGTDLAALAIDYGAATVLASQYNSAITGPADAKDVAETLLEQLSHQLARALANHYKKTGDLTNRAKVNVSLGTIQKKRDQHLHAFGIEVRDLAQGASAHADAVNRGITAARIAALTAAVNNFGTLLNAPRGAIVNRSALGRELETVIAGLVEDVTDMDDLALQFDATEEGRAFIAAWKQARIIVDAGHGPGEAPPTPPPPPTP